MIANYQQPGSAIDYPNGTSSAIVAGQVVSLTTRIGVAGTDIPASEVGSLYVKGVFTMPKATSTAITIGAAVYYDATGDNITTTAASHIPAGWAIAAAAENDTTVQVCIG
ncbi:DUF2190 family protein [Faecalibacterium sp. DFI.5.82]|uniref:DUF2190 family protein n=1 Tax=Faecalibacterium sp. DFI.5.82 TaxID=3031725 RepID=UPI0023B0F403|nr:DUF2190 family protein [Faecalibacterium sp. DFI.5.82]MDE8690754.1 DUF2190 family protein [Faecalibacterium sp. DFI.5.82]